MTAALSPAPSDDAGGPGVTKVSETQYNVDRKEVDAALSNLSEVATQARIVPSFKNGKPMGSRCSRSKTRAFFQKSGSKNGDVIQKINGYEINSPEKDWSFTRSSRTPRPCPWKCSVAAKP